MLKWINNKTEYITLMVAIAQLAAALIGLYLTFDANKVALQARKEALEAQQISSYESLSRRSHLLVYIDGVVGQAVHDLRQCETIATNGSSILETPGCSIQSTKDAYTAMDALGGAGQDSPEVIAALAKLRAALLSAKDQYTLGEASSRLEQRKMVTRMAGDISDALSNLDQSLFQNLKP